MKEIWKDVKGYEGLYMVSNHGNLKAKPKQVNYSDGRSYKFEEKPIKCCENTNGYYYACLHKNGTVKNVRIHRLVADAFLPKVEGKPCINHIDGNKRNNNVANLEWCTQKENVHHAISKGLNKEARVNNSSSIPVIQLDKTTGEEIALYPSIAEALRQNNLSPTIKHGIINCCKNKQNRKTAGGFGWRYANV